MLQTIKLFLLLLTFIGIFSCQNVTQGIKTNLETKASPSEINKEKEWGLINPDNLFWGCL